MSNNLKSIKLERAQIPYLGLVKLFHDAQDLNRVNLVDYVL